ncbi:MAG: hypothetical protein ACYTAF_12750, partial [Planctomycetota bacterium]
MRYSLLVLPLLLLVPGAAAQDGASGGLEVFDQADKPPKSFPGDAVITFGVRNTGERPVRDVVASLTFLDKKKSVVRKVRLYLKHYMNNEAEDEYEVTMPDFPAYASVQVRVACKKEDLDFEAGEMGHTESIHVGECRFARLTDGSLLVTGQVRNGLARDVADVTVFFRFGDVKRPLTLPGRVFARTVRRFTFFMDRPPEARKYTFRVRFRDPGTS